MDLFGKEIVTIFTSQGEIDIDEDDLANRSQNYSILFYHQNPYKKINYSHPIQPMTYSFLKYYFDNTAGLNSNKDVEDPKKIYDLIKKKNWEDYEMETLKEVYMFLKDWEIDETLQRVIVKAIQKKESPEAIVSIYYFLIESHINVDIFEEIIISPNFDEYFNIIIKNSKTSKENLYKIFKNSLKHFTREEMNSILREMFKTIGVNVLKILFPWINLKECSTENLMCMFDISSEENNIKNSENNVINDINNNNSKEKNPKKNDENNNADQNKDLIGQLVSIIRRVMITNVKITEEKEKIKQMFIETEINEHSTDIELFHFHKNYLKNRYYYLNHFETEYNDSYYKNQSNGHKVQRTKDKFQYSKEMIERGMKFKISKIFLKLIEEEEEEKNIIQKCKSFLNSKDITLLSLFDLSLNIYEKGNKRKFEIIANFVIQKVSNKEDFFLYNILIKNKNDKIYESLSKETQISKINYECEKNKTKIKSIKIPKSVGKIYSSAFSSCTSLIDVEIEEGIIEISFDAFSQCSSLKKIKIPKSVKLIDYGAFKNCTELYDIKIQEGVASIAEKSFSQCYSLIKIKIPKTVEIIGKKAFEDCIALTEIEIEEGITTIEDRAFLGCSKLEKIKIPKSVKTIGRAAFSGCLSLTEVEIEDGIIKIDNGEIIEFKSKKKYKLSDLSKWLPLKEIEIEEGKVEICSCEFAEFRSLERIKIPKSVTKINSHAFHQCSSLTEVEINEGVEIIDEWAFMNCFRLEKIKIPKSTVTIDKHAFIACFNLKEVEINEGIKIIGFKAFYACVSLSKIKIPKSVTKIEIETFSKCSSLTEVEISEGVVSIGDGAFSSCESLKVIKIPKSIRTIGKDAFHNCTSLKEFFVPKSSTIEIDGTAFSGIRNPKIKYY